MQYFKWNANILLISYCIVFLKKMNAFIQLGGSHLIKSDSNDIYNVTKEFYLACTVYTMQI